MTKTLVKLPSRNRPRLFFETLTEYLADETVRILVTLDRDDPQLPKYLTGLEHLERVKVRVGHSKSKVEAINDGVAEEDWRYLILASDDMVPERHDYARYIVSLFDLHFPDGDGMLHLNDGRNGASLNCLPIMDRKYFDRDGYVYHPAYKNLWSDNEAQAVSEARGRAVYVDKVVIRHHWTSLTGQDELHLRNEATYHEDAATFEARKAKGFP